VSMVAGSSMQATRTRARPASVIASVACAIDRRSTPLTAPLHPACPAACAKFALHTMYAHRLWTKLWMALGHPEENSSRPGGNAGVTTRGTSPVHSHPRRSPAANHSRCAQPQHTLAGRIVVIPGIHRPYDDYQSCNDRQIQTKVGKRPSGAFRAAPQRRGLGHFGAAPGRARDETPDQIRRGDR
jgi:hypothetical protein